MLTSLMRRLGWVPRAEHQKLLLQHVRLLDDHEKMIRLAQALLQQTGEGERPASAEAAKPAKTPDAGAEIKPPKLH